MSIGRDQPGSRSPLGAQAAPVHGGWAAPARAQTADPPNQRSAADGAAGEALSALAQGAPVGLFYADAAGLLRAANPRALELAGRALADLAASGWQESAHPDDLRSAAAAWRRRADRGADFERELRLLRPDGEERWVRVRIRPAAAAPGYAGTIEEIGEARRARADLERVRRDLDAARAAQEARESELSRAIAELDLARRKAEDAAQVKGEFLAMMSHEVRTPLNGVIGMTSLLLESRLTSEQRDLAETVRNSGAALLAILNDILDLSTIEAGNPELESTDFELRRVVEQTVELFITPADKKGVDLSVLVASDVPSVLRGDPGRLRQILLNLLGNALKFTARGEVSLRVEQAGAEFGRTAPPGSGGEILLRFAVRDTGIGIAPNRRGQLFQAFSQLDGSHARRYGGTGLGLAICKRLAELMQGEIGVDSEEGQGSTFWFTARLRPGDPAACAEVVPRTSLAGVRVLIVDDSRTNRGILRHHCRAWGMRTETARDALDGLRSLRLAIAEKRPFELVVFETLLPGMDGFELARVIRDDATLAGVKLVVLSSAGLRGDAERARRAGLDGYLTKPIREAHLFDCLAAVLAGAKHMAPADDYVGYTRSALITRHSVPAPVLDDRPRVLIAEDNLVNQKLAIRLVERLGYRPTIASNGAEAVAACAKQHYAAVLMDCQMPVMDGLEATRAIRRAEPGSGPRLPIIAMTANAMHGDRERCLEAGMDDYLAKPVRPADLEAALARWVRTRIPALRP